MGVCHATDHSSVMQKVPGHQSGIVWPVSAISCFVKPAASQSGTARRGVTTHRQVSTWAVPSTYSMIGFDGLLIVLTYS